MAKVKDVLVKCHETVPFPWSPRKITKAGYNPIDFLLEVGRELQACEDINTPQGKAIIEILLELKILA